MIELIRYARVKPRGLVSAAVMPDGVVRIQFKRHDVEDGREVEPEEYLLTFTELEARLVDAKMELEALHELLALKPVKAE